MLRLPRPVWIQLAILSVNTVVSVSTVPVMTHSGW